MLSTYLSFTVFFFAGAGAFALAAGQLNPVILLSFIPAGIKLLLDSYPVIRHGFILHIMRVISGRQAGQREKNRRKYGIRHISPRPTVLLVLAAALLIAQIALQMGSWPVTAMFVLLFLVNFQLMRIADSQTFYRSYLSMLLFVLLSTGNIWFLVAGAFLLLVNPRWVDDLHLMDDYSARQHYPPLAKTVWSREKKGLLERFISPVKPGSRVLFQYTGMVRRSPLRVLMWPLEACLYDRNAELLPHDQTFYTSPEWSYDWSCHLSEDGDLDALDKMLESCSISYVMVFSADLLARLVERGYRLLSELAVRELQGFVHEDNIASGSIYLLYRGMDYNFCSERSAALERRTNRMTLKGVEGGNEYTVHHTYHSDWRAYQSGKRMDIKPVEVCGLNFMQVKAHDSHDIVMKFGRVNHIIR
jgi:hypothetical protein